MIRAQPELKEQPEIPAGHKGDTSPSPDGLGSQQELCHVPPDRLLALEECARRAAANFGEDLDRQRRDWGRALGKTKEVSILWSSTPLRAAFSKRWFQMFMIVMAVASSKSWVATAGLWQQNGRHSFQHYMLQHRQNDPRFGQAPCISSLQLLWHGIPRVMDSSVQGNCSVQWLHLTARHDMNGFSCNIAGSGAEWIDTHGLLMLGSHDTLNWEPLFDSANFLEFGSVYQTNKNEEGLSVVDLRPSSVWVLHKVLAPGLTLLSLILAPAIASFGRSRTAVQVLGWGLLVAIVLNCLAGVLEETPIVAFFEFTNGLILVPLMVVVFFYERWYLAAVFLDGVLDVSQGVLKLLLLPGTDSFPANHLYAGVTFILFGTVCYVYRRQVLHDARQLVQGDQDKYDSVWQSIIAQPRAADDLQHIRALCRSMGPGPASGCVRQLRYVAAGEQAARHRVGAWGWGWLGGGSEQYGAQVDEVEPVTSLGVVYAQAVLVEHLLRRKVQRIAASCGAFLFARSEEEESKAALASWDQATRDPELLARIRWGGLKKPERAMEKVVRCYQGEVSRLVDVCRESLVLDSLQDLAAALRAIQADSELVVERLKNRLDSDYASAASVGYRDVALNLRVCSADARNLGVDLHVCELQLMLRCFATIKTDEGHKRYVSYRNLRGE